MCQIRLFISKCLSPLLRFGNEVGKDEVERASFESEDRRVPDDAVERPIADDAEVAWVFEKRHEAVHDDDIEIDIKDLALEIHMFRIEEQQFLPATFWPAKPVEGRRNGNDFEAAIDPLRVVGHTNETVIGRKVSPHHRAKDVDVLRSIFVPPFHTSDG